MKRLLHKITTKPVWWLETRRSYPIRDKWNLLPPIPAPAGPVVFAVLTTPRTFNDTLWVAWSWLRFLGDAVRPEIYVDGPIDDEMRRSLDFLLPGTALFEAKKEVRALDGLPAHVADFVLNHPMGRKLGLYLLLQKRGKFLYSDADVLAFAEPVELLEALASPHGGAYFCEEGEGSYSPDVLARAARLGLEPVASLNAGLLLIPQNCLSVELAAQLMADWAASSHSWFLEQTVMACLLRSAPMTPLPRDRYRLTDKRQFYWQADVDYSRIAARHFSGPTRHVMYGRGLPWLLRHVVNESRA